MKIKRLVLLACLAAVLSMVSACDKDKDPEGGEIIVQGNTLAEKLDWVKNYAEGGKTYTLEVSSDENFSWGISFRETSYSGNITTVKLIGIGGIKTISISPVGTLFDIGYNYTLILDENIVLKGTENNNAPLVKVAYSGTLIMNNGSKITGNSSSSYYGGGVYVGGGTFTMNGGEISSNSDKSATYHGDGGGVYVDGGTFTMNGGTISGNTAGDWGGGVYVGGGTFTMTGGTISGNINQGPSSLGGGVYVRGASTFNKTGGIITGYSSDTENGNVVKNSSGVVQSNKGHAVYVSGYNNISLYKDTTAGQGDNLTYISHNGEQPPTISGAWDE